MSQDHTRSENPNFGLPEMDGTTQAYVGTTEPPRRGERAIYHAGIRWEAGSQLTIAPLSRFAPGFSKTMALGACTYFIGGCHPSQCRQRV